MEAGVEKENEPEEWEHWPEEVGDRSVKKARETFTSAIGILNNMTYGGQLREFLPGAASLYGQSGHCLNRYS